MTAALGLVSLLTPAAVNAQIEARPYVTGLAQPVAFVADPTSQNRQFILEQAGRIRLVSDGVLQQADFLDLRSHVLSGGERGLLGMALDPGYSTNRRFYVFFTRQGAGAAFGGLVVARFNRSLTDPAAADPASRFDLKWISLANQDYIPHDAFGNHNGGCLQFGPDGYLYFGTGDGGGGNDPLNQAQHPASLLGKILRIDVNVPADDANGYRVPSDNPFVDNDPVDAFEEIWAFGLRNPWRFSFDHPAHGGALFIGDVGQSAWEEVNVESDGTGGRNYGWPLREGAHVNPNASTTATLAYTPTTDPVFEYSHSVGRSITGGVVYRGEELGVNMQGRYFFADYVDERVWSVAVTKVGGTAQFTDLKEHTAQLDVGSLSSFGTDQQGEMYLVSYDTGTVYRVGVPCTFTVTVGVTSFARNGGTGVIRVDTQDACAWQATSLAPWVSSASSGSGNTSGTFVFRVDANQTGSGRSGVLTVAGRAITITQTAADPLLGDFDGNGSGDILWQRSDGTVAIWFMRGTQLLSGQPFGPGTILDSEWRLAASGDFDGDGSRDAIFQHSGDGRLAAWIMSGATLLRGLALTPDVVADTNWRIRGAGDMNGDGRDDLIWQHQLTGDVAVWLMSGATLVDGRLLSPSTVADTAWQIVGVADINRDGHADLVWHHQTSGRLAVWFMNRTTLASGILMSPAQVSETTWRVRAVADLDGDGDADLIWRNTFDGRLAVWFMREATQLSGTLLDPPEVTDGSWQIVGPR